MHKNLKINLKFAIISSIITLFAIALIKSSGVVEIAHNKLFAEKKERSEENQNIIKIPTQISASDHIKKGDLLLENNFLTLAINEYSAAINLEPRYEKAYIKLCEIYIKNENYEKAFETAKKLYEMDNGNLNYLNLYLKTLIQTEKIEEGIKIFENKKQVNAESSFYKGILFALNDSFQESETAFNEAYSNNPSASLAHDIKIFLDAYSEFHASEGSQAIFMRALVAESLIKTNFHKATISLLYKIIKEKYDYRDAWIMLGYSFIKIKNYFDAIEALQTALDLDPTKAETRYFLGLAYFGSKNYNDALSNIEFALENNFQPRIEALQQFAEIAILTEDYEKALKSYIEIINANKTALDIYIRPMWLLIEKLNRPSEAINLAYQAVQASADSAMAYSLLGWAQTASGQYKIAYKNLEKAINLDPNLAAAYLNLGSLYELQNDKENAKLNYKKSYDLDPSSPIGTKAGEKYNEIITNQ